MFIPHIVNVKVVYLVTWPVSGSEAGVGRQTSLVSLFFSFENHVVFMLTGSRIYM